MDTFPVFLLDFLLWLSGCALGLTVGLSIVGASVCGGDYIAFLCCQTPISQ